MRFFRLACVVLTASAWSVSAQVEVELIYTDEGWSPYLSLDEAQKLDDVRESLRRGELDVASRLARVFKLTPVPA